MSSNPVYDHENIDVDPNIQNFTSIFGYIEGSVAGVVVKADNYIKIRGTNSFVDLYGSKGANGVVQITLKD